MTDQLQVPPQVALEMIGVTRAFEGPPPVTAVRDCSVRIPKGVMATFQGPSGSGKSTLLHIMALLDRPTAGHLWLDGIDTTSLKEDERTRLRGTHIGLVFQQFHLMHHRTVLENVMLAGLYTGIPEVDRRNGALAAILRVGLEGREDQQVATLSGGEQQRVAIARALAAGPQVLLCDEPTGNLDSERSNAVVELLKGINSEGRTVIIVSHDPDVVAVGQQQYHVKDGRVTLQ